MTDSVLPLKGDELYQPIGKKEEEPSVKHSSKRKGKLKHDTTKARLVQTTSAPIIGRQNLTKASNRALQGVVIEPSGVTRFKASEKVAKTVTGKGGLLEAPAEMIQHDARTCKKTRSRAHESHKYAS